MCATGLAWSDEATATDTAHRLEECSNRGECDRSTGRCKCMSGFSGAACERSSCPRGCSGHGQCRSMSDYAEDYRGADSIQYLYDSVSLAGRNASRLDLLVRDDVISRAVLAASIRKVTRSYCIRGES